MRRAFACCLVVFAVSACGVEDAANVEGFEPANLAPNLDRATASQPGSTVIAKPTDTVFVGRRGARAQKQNPNPQQPTELPATPDLKADVEVAYFPGNVPVTELSRVELTMKLEGSTANGATLELIAPSGFVFDRRTTQLTGDANDAQLRTFTLQVAGTLVDTSHLTGTWTARLAAKDGTMLATTFFEVES